MRFLPKPAPRSGACPLDSSFSSRPTAFDSVGKTSAPAQTKIQGKVECLAGEATGAKRSALPYQLGRRAGARGGATNVVSLNSAGKKSTHQPLIYARRQNL